MAGTSTASSRTQSPVNSSRLTRRTVPSRLTVSPHSTTTSASSNRARPETFEAAIAAGVPQMTAESNPSAHAPRRHRPTRATHRTATRNSRNRHCDPREGRSRTATENARPDKSATTLSLSLTLTQRANPVYSLTHVGTFWGDVNLLARLSPRKLAPYRI